MLDHHRLSLTLKVQSFQSKTSSPQYRCKGHTWSSPTPPGHTLLPCRPICSIVIVNSSPPWKIHYRRRTTKIMGSIFHQRRTPANPATPIPPNTSPPQKQNHGQYRYPGKPSVNLTFRVNLVMNLLSLRTMNHRKIFSLVISLFPNAILWRQCVDCSPLN